MATVSDVMDSAVSVRQCMCGVDCDRMCDADERRSPLQDIIESPTRSARGDRDNRDFSQEEETAQIVAEQPKVIQECSPHPAPAESTPGKQPSRSWKSILAESPAEDSTSAVDVLPSNGSFTKLREKESELDHEVQKVDEALRGARRRLRDSEAGMAWLRDENTRLRNENEQLRSERVSSALNSSSHGAPPGTHFLVNSEYSRGGLTASEQLDTLLSERTLLKSQLSEARYHLDTVREEAAAHAHEIGMLRARNAELEAGVGARGYGVADSSEEVAAVMREKEASRAASARYHAQLRALDKKLKSLERYSAQMKEEKEELETQARRAHLDLIDIEKKMQNRVVVDIREIHHKNLELATLEERLTAAQLGLARALRIIANSKEMGHLVSYDEDAGQFAFVGWDLGEDARRTGDDDAGAYSAGSGDDNDDEEGGNGPSQRHGRQSQHQQVGSRRNREKYASAWILARGSGGLATGTDGGVYSGLTSQQESKNVKLSGKDEATLRTLKRAVAEENKFLRARKVRLSDLLPPGMGDGVSYSGAGVDRVVRKGDDVLHCRKQESDYWIPYAAFVAAQQFKNEAFPKLPISTFYPFLIQLNRVWHERMQRRLRSVSPQRDAAYPPTAQRAPQQDAGSHDNDVRIPARGAGEAVRAKSSQRRRQPSRERAISASGVRAVVWSVPGNGGSPGRAHYPCVELRQQVDAVLREIRLRIHEKTALYLFRLLEKVVKNVLYAYASLEEHVCSAKKAVTDDAGSKAEPATTEEQRKQCTDVSLSPFLHKVSETVRTVSLHSSHAILTACDELRAFLQPLYNELGGTSTTTVPAESVAQLLESVLDFTEDVRQEVVHSTDSLCRIADAADQKALDTSVSTNASD